MNDISAIRASRQTRSGRRGDSAVLKMAAMVWSFVCAFRERCYRPFVRMRRWGAR